MARFLRALPFSPGGTSRNRTHSGRPSETSQVAILLMAFVIGRRTCCWLPVVVARAIIA
ncbi:hypothetical protein M405DRAFT_480752 [Rhizopogon salebrosus TDB-379]|nr:hypothetical protein M405DRAFT_480752 [Rhizopogon salebrosus TDB-379]